MKVAKFMTAFAAASVLGGQGLGATESRLVGAWDLTSFVINSHDGSKADFCKGATGQLLYSLSGHVSVAINCGAQDGDASPSDSYGGYLFYAGTFSLANDVVTHKITQSSSVSIIGRSLDRRVDELDEKNLVLTGRLGEKGDTLRIVWTRSGFEETDAAKIGDTFSMLTYLKVKPGTEGQFIEEVQTIIKASRSEPRNIAWYVQQSQSDPTEFMYYTRWPDQAALDYHLKSAPLASYIARTSKLLEPGYPQFARYNPIDYLNSKKTK